MSSKATCPACDARLSGVYDAIEGEAPGCPNCGLPGSALRQIADARRRCADADLTAQLENAVIRAGKAERALTDLRRRVYRARSLFAEWEREDPFGSVEWCRMPDRDDD